MTDPAPTLDDRAQAVVLAARAMVDAGGPLPVADLARTVHLSESTLRRAFDAVLGVGPRAFGQAVRTGTARSLLRSGTPVARALTDAGFGSVRGFYETAAPTMGMTPSAYAGGAADERLTWTAVSSTVGTILVVASERGLCAVHIGPDRGQLLADVATEFPGALLTGDDPGLADIGAAVASVVHGGPATQIPLDLRGTAFQARVWESLTRIPLGQTRTYAEVAVDIGRPTAVRAVASACARNAIALVVPCHRVVRTDGGLGGYRWGIEVKRELLRIEGASSSATEVS